MNNWPLVSYRNQFKVKSSINEMLIQLQEYRTQSSVHIRQQQSLNQLNENALAHAHHQIYWTNVKEDNKLLMYHWTFFPYNSYANKNFLQWVIPPQLNHSKRDDLKSLLFGSNKTWPNTMNILKLMFGSNKTWPNINNNGNNHIWLNYIINIYYHDRS